jgi:hypothetical protein
VEELTTQGRHDEPRRLPLIVAGIEDRASVRLDVDSNDTVDCISAESAGRAPRPQPEDELAGQVLEQHCLVVSVRHVVKRKERLHLRPQDEVGQLDRVLLEQLAVVAFVGGGGGGRGERGRVLNRRKRDGR